MPYCYNLVTASAQITIQLTFFCFNVFYTNNVKFVDYLVPKASQMRALNFASLIYHMI